MCFEEAHYLKNYSNYFEIKFSIKIMKRDGVENNDERIDLITNENINKQIDVA